jgi:hypothetical protein
MKAIRFLRSAELEMLDAARYYEFQAPGLGDKFLDKVKLILLFGTSLSTRNAGL